MQESELASAQNATVHGDHGQPYNQVSNPDLNPIIEMEKYYLLIRRIFSDIDACKTDLERERYHRIRNGVELLHLGENNKFDAGLVKQLESRFPDLIPSRYVFFPLEVKQQSDADSVQCGFLATRNW